MRTSVFAGAIVLSGSLLAACGGGSGATPATSPPTQPIAVTIAAKPSSLQIDAGQSESLTPTVSNDPYNRGVRWTVTCQSGLLTACGQMAKATSASGAAVTYSAPNSTGSPSSAATVILTATSVTDSRKNASVTLTVMPVPTPVSPAPQWPTGNVGQYVVFDFSGWVQGGVPPFAWSLDSGTVPPGMKLSANGQIAGIPTATYSSTFTLTAADLGNPSISVNVPIGISIGPMLPLTMSPPPGALPSGTVGQQYDKWRDPVFYEWHYGAWIKATGGVQTYTFSWAPALSSSLPPGISLTPFTGCGGPCTIAVIGGTPTTAGTFSFSVTVTDSESPAKQITAQYSIAVQ